MQVQLRIVAGGASAQAQANARGRLFEQLMAEVLRHHGCTIDRKPSVNYAGMEIDIEGHETLTGVPFYAECKCYDTDIDSPKLQAFYGKYMTRWRRDHRCRGLFIALPRVNGHARGFFKENCEGATDTTISLLEDQGVLKSIFNSRITVLDRVIAEQVPPEVGSAGDQTLLYTEHGPIWVQYVIAPGSAIADKYVLFNKHGDQIGDSQTLEYLLDVFPDLQGFRPIPTLRAPQVASDTLPVTQANEQVVEVHGSSSWFEYHFPASPEFFIGRADALREVSNFALDVLRRSTSARGLLFTGHSGWGKSSAVLAADRLLQDLEHFSVVIDCRSLSSPQSVLRVVDFAISKFAARRGALFGAAPNPISGFEGAVKTLLSISRELEKDKQLFFIFLDQFENVFFVPDTLKRIRDLLLKLCDAEANIILGFAWKTDLIGATNDFPYHERDAVVAASKRIPIEPFSDIETNALLDKLRTELRTELRKDLRFFLSEFSQGFPWLLKKLCAHVKTQREAGVPQLDIANRLLNIQQLFKDDLRGLAPEEEEVLRRIAKAAPISTSELSDHYRPDVVQSLIDRRLIVRIGTRFDVYWDIFRDFLNYDRVPVQENYLLRVQIGTVSKAVTRLVKAAGPMDLGEFRQQMRFSEHSAMNVVRDLRLLGLAVVESGMLSVNVAVDPTAGDAEIFQSVRPFLRDRLAQNRLVSRLIHELRAEANIRLDDIAKRLSRWCPYVTATQSTWRMYARILASWMDIADLATYDARHAKLGYYEPATEFRERDLVQIGKRRGSGLLLPSIQYSPVEQIAIAIGDAFEGKRPDWSTFTKSTVSKGFATLEDLGFLEKTERGFRILTDFTNVMKNAEARHKLFRSAVLELPAIRAFVAILNKYSSTGKSHLDIGRELREMLGVEWKDGTAKTHVKIMLDWARHLEFAPGWFAEHARRARVSKRLG